MTFAGTSAGTFPTGLVFFFLLMLIVPRNHAVCGAVWESQRCGSGKTEPPSGFARNAASLSESGFAVPSFRFIQVTLCNTHCVF